MSAINLDATTLAALILAAGALGTASFGIVDAFKLFIPERWTGMNRVEKGLGFLGHALRVAYGSDYKQLLRAQFRDGRSKGGLPRTLRQGSRIGLTPETAGGLANAVGVVGTEDLVAVASQVKTGEELTADQRAVLARFEMALDARIDSQLSLAETDHARRMRLLAALVAVGLSYACGEAASSLGVLEAVGVENGEHGGYGENGGDPMRWLIAGIVGLAAVPLAPVAKDVASALQSYAKHTKAKP